MFKCGSGFFSFRKRWQPRHMDYIDKSHCNLTMVPDDVLRHERYLEELLLDANQIQELPKAIFRMYKLRKLILCDNEILDLTEDLGNLVALEEFDISKNDIRGVPECIEKLKKLTTLDVSNNTLGELPDSITRLKDLRTLVVNDVALGEIPPEIGSLECLVILELRDNCIRFLPMSFSFLANLQKLDLGGNELEELPDTIGQLTNLQELWLDNNYLTCLPSEIGEITTLQCLDVSENRIEELPEEIGGLISLSLLIVSSNTLHELPEGIGLLENLQILKAEQNELDDLSEAIGGCVSLEELMLTDNSIEFLPSAIGCLKSLTNLNIDRNRLYTLPPEIGNCTGITLLCARDNQIDKVPKEIGNCRNLTVLDLSGNKLENLPFTVSTLPLKALWLSQNQSQSVLKLQVDDETTEEKVLTCFLFPQDKLKPASSIDNFMNEVYDEHPEEERSWNSIIPNQNQNNLKQPIVQFPDTIDDTGPLKEPNLTRKGTPYPKDMRERHPHMIRKRSNSDDAVKGGGGSARDSFHSDTSQLSDLCTEKKKGGVTIATTDLVIGDDGGIDNPFLLDEDDQPEEEVKAVTISENMAANSSSDDEDDDDDDDDDDEEYDKHVGFIINEDAVLDRAEDDVCKLQRKDTPHHLRGKRIVDTDEDKERLQEILLNIEKRKSEELDDDADKTGLDAVKCAISFQNGIADKDESDDDITDDEETDSKGIPFRYKKTTFQEPTTQVNDEVDGKENVHTVKENGDLLFNQRVTIDDGCEVIEQETIMKLYEELTAQIYRDGPSLGINIAGGLGTTSFQDDEQLADLETRTFEDEGVFITKIASDSPAGKLGILQVGDKIIKVNDVDISQFSHDDAVKALRHAGNLVTLVALREVTNEDEINLSLNREEKNVRFAAEPEVEDIEVEAVTIPVMLKRDAKGLGFSIAGGKGSNPYKGSEEGIYISKLSEDGPAALDKRLQLGDKLLNINGIDVRNSSHEEVVKILTGSLEKVSLVAYRERVINKKMKPMSQINGIDCAKTVGESTQAEAIPNDVREEDEPKLLVEEIVLKKSEGPLGISIVGGCDRASHPFGVKEPGVFVSKVNPSGEAAKTNLCVGDRILRVNDKDMRNAMHHDAVEALVANEHELKLLVRHDPPPPGIMDIAINKKLGEKLGISIRGGAKGHPGNPLDKNDEGIFVSKVNASGAVSRSGQLKVGMRILEVNAVSLLGASHVDAVRALRTAGDNISMVVADGYDPLLVDDGNQEDILFNPALCEPTRFSPDSASSATSGDSFPEEISYHKREEGGTPSPTLMSETNDIDRKSGQQIRRTPSEQRAIEADKRAKWRQERMAALDSDAKKAQVVIAQSKQYSSTSLDDGSLVFEEERTSS